jgi:hypothetical protein
MRPWILRLNRIELIDQGHPRLAVPLGSHAKVRGAFGDVHPAVVFVDDDVPGFLAVVVRFVRRAVGDVVGDEVAEVAVDVLPGREVGQAAAGGAGVFDLFAGLLGFVEADGKVVDGRVVANRCSPGGSSALPW